MTCIACEELPKRITNIFIDDELKEKFENITGIAIFHNVFICDPCSDILNQSHSFKLKCLDIYERNFNIKFDHCNLKTEIEINDEEQLENLDSSTTSQAVTIEEHLETDEEQSEIFASDPLQNHIESPKTRVRLRYTIKEKLRAIHLSEQTSNRQAAKILGIDESCIRKWRHMKEKIKNNENQDACKVGKMKSATGHNDVQEMDDTEIECEIQTEIIDEILPEAEIMPVRQIRTRKSYSSGEKLEVVAFAEVTGNRQAAKVFKIDESCIRKWRTQKKMLIEINQERGTRRKPNLRFPEVESRLKAFVIQKLEDGILLKPSDIKAESKKIARELNIENFKGTSSYIFKFMERYHFPSSRGKSASKTRKKSVNEDSSELSVDII